MPNAGLQLGKGKYDSAKQKEKLPKELVKVYLNLNKFKTLKK